MKQRRQRGRRIVGLLAVLGLVASCGSGSSVCGQARDHLASCGLPSDGECDEEFASAVLSLECSQIVSGERSTFRSATSKCRSFASTWAKHITAGRAYYCGSPLTGTSEQILRDLKTQTYSDDYYLCLRGSRYWLGWAKYFVNESWSGSGTVREVKPGYFERGSCPTKQGTGTTTATTGNREACDPCNGYDALIVPGGYGKYAYSCTTDGCWNYDRIYYNPDGWDGK